MPAPVSPPAVATALIANSPVSSWTLTFDGIEALIAICSGWAPISGYSQLYERFCVAAWADVGTEQRKGNRARGRQLECLTGLEGHDFSCGGRGQPREWVDRWTCGRRRGHGDSEIVRSL